MNHDVTGEYPLINLPRPKESTVAKIMIAFIIIGTAASFGFTVFMWKTLVG